MEKDSGKIFRELKDDVSTYVELKLELLKLSTYERSGQLIAILSYGLILLFLAFFAILFIFLALGFFMGDIFGSMGTGFAFVAVLYLLLIGLIIMNKGRICNTVLNVVIAALNGNDEKDDATDTKKATDATGETDF
ncbi:phage holin family protein [Parabacteroides goldsteinii]|uniref:phage holin family protein n=1 Tax=Parabacteroides goldsteinii TaxID=328812 RepID=UPI0025A0FE81|nr:phage holin family protein [Parabacteroides goldsteinii]